MKKILVSILGILAIAAMPLSVSAASSDEVSKTTTLTTNVPSSYELTIPATVDIAYGEKNAQIGSVKVKGKIAEDEYVKVSAKSEHNYCLTNEKNSSKTIRYRPEDIFASSVNGSAPLFRGRDFTSKEVNSTGGICLVVARIDDYAWEHSIAGTYSDNIVFSASLETETTDTPAQ